MPAATDDRDHRHAPDGYPVHGWLVPPPGPGPHPVLLLIHGGPDWQFQYQLFDEARSMRRATPCAGESARLGGYGEAHARAIRDGSARSTPTT